MSGVEQPQEQSNNNNGGGIPLTTWINSALNSISNNNTSSTDSNYNQPTSKINSTLYTSAALGIAQSLVCQLNLSYSLNSSDIGDNNDNGVRQELILPNDISNWANSIIIHTNTNLNNDEQQGIPILNISSAEFITPQNSQNTNDQVIKCQSKDENKHIYSLGIVLYQLFSGNQASLEREVLDKLVNNAQLRLKEVYDKLSESERVRFLFMCLSVLM